MDFDSLKNQVSNLTLYDIKAGFRKAQNAVMNYTPMEALVREATNNEPWGASSSMMQEIANGTFNYAQLNEIMPMIYKRFTEKAAEEWRQIYKALQLLEFLIKNGSERVVDDARSHISLLKMLRQFHYIDQQGKDQGVNVRNRAKELGELLSDVERIRAERKKSKQTRNKYRGHEGGAGIAGSSSGGRYGGFGSETGGAAAGGYGGYSGGVYGDGGGFGGEGQDDYGSTQSRRDRFEEYDEYDDGGAQAPTSRRKPRGAGETSSKTAAPPKAKQPEVDLFDFGDDDLTSAPTAAASNGKATAAADDFGTMQSGAPTNDDDFDDFQSASPTATAVPTSATQFAAPQPAPGGNSLSSILNSISPPPSGQFSHNPPAPAAAANYAAFTSAMAPSVASPAAQQQKPAAAAASGPNYFGSIPVQGNASTPGAPSNSAQSAAAKKPASADPFANLAVGSKKGGAGGQKGPTMAAMAKQQTSQGLWGTPTTQQAQQSGASGDLI